MSLRVTLAFLLGALQAHAIVWRADIDTVETKAQGEMRQVGKVLYSPLQVFGGSCLALGEEWVLTSRHGTAQWAANFLKVRFPALNDTAYEVHTVFLCDEGDFALLKLKKRVRGAKNISLYQGHAEVGKRAWIGGFGHSGPAGKITGSALFHSGHNRIDQLRREKLSISLSKPEDKTAEPDEAIVALFDSGSPLFIQTEKGWKLAGIASSATNANKPDYGDRGNYARVSQVRKWIVETMKK